MKKFMLSILVIVLIFANIIFVSANSDEPSSWALEFINEAESRGTIDSSFFCNYKSKMTRGEFAYLSVVLYEEIRSKNMK